MPSPVAFRSLAILLLVCTAPVAGADELLLKEGKRIEWVALRDQGDTYEVETPQGIKLTIKKADVEKILPAAKDAAPPLTGASFTFDRKKKLTQTNLLANLDLKKSAIQGNWTLKGTELQASPGVDANWRLAFTASVPEEYDLALDLSRKSGDGDFQVGLVIGGKQGVLVLDAVGGTVSAFCQEGKPLDVSSGVAARFFANAATRSMVCMVRKNGVVIQVDGRDFLTLSPSDFPKLFVPSTHAVPARDAIFLVCWKGSYSVTKAVLSSPKN